MSNPTMKEWQEARMDLQQAMAEYAMEIDQFVIEVPK